MNSSQQPPETTRPPVLRSLFAGLLMGMANLIPGVSGGTMILAMGLYTEFIDSVADVTAFRFRLRRFLFLGVVGVGAVAAIVGLAPAILYLLFHHDSAMYALFIGLTIGGAPTLTRMLVPVNATAVFGTACGVTVMIAIVLARDHAVMPHNTLMDIVAGLVGAITMVLPGISGSYMLLIMGQYDRVLGAVDLRDLRIIIPVALGALVGVVLLSNALKLLLHRFERPTVSFLLGMLLGSVLGLWPFGKQPSVDALAARPAPQLARFAERKGVPIDADLPRDELAKQILRRWDARDRSEDYSASTVFTAAAMAVLGFLVTWTLSKRQSPAPDSSTREMQFGSELPPSVKNP
jgi:putative membrane protein